MDLNLSIGQDIVNIKRFGKSVQQKSFVEKVFHPNEISYCEGKINKIGSYAARFAAKEACVKALGTGFFAAHSLVPRDIWVENNEQGKPSLCFSEKMSVVLKDKNLRHHSVSLSHHEEYATAHVILW